MTLIILLVSIISLFYAIIWCRQGFSNPLFLYLLFNLINFYGTLPLLDLGEPADLAHFRILYFGIFSIIFGGLLGAYIFNLDDKTILNWTNKNIVVESGFSTDFVLYSIVAVSIVVGSLYYYSVGYNIILLGIMNLAGYGPDIESVSTLRLASYNQFVGGKYFYPGYVNQFKNTLFPICLGFLVLRSHFLGRSIHPFHIVLSIICVVFLLGTGQRGAFVIASLMVGLSYFVIADKKERKKIMGFGSLFVLFFFFISSFIIGRNESDGEGVGDNIKGLGVATVERITSANQNGAAVGFRELIYHRPIQWGKEWGQDILGVLPGHSGSSLSGEVGKILWGGDGKRGTAPPSNWTSIYHNFGYLGVISLPIIISFLLSFLRKRYYTGEKALLRTICYFSNFVLLASWISGSPLRLFNVGMVAVIVLYYLITGMRQFLIKSN